MLSRSYSLKSLDFWMSLLKLNRGSHKPHPSHCMRMSMRQSFWDVPLFADTTQVKANRTDAKVIDKASKQVRVIEMSCPWLEKRESRDFEKTTKYSSQLRLELTNRYPEYKVNQYNIIMDVLGGCSKEVEKNIKELVGDKCESIMRQMQKAILSSSLHIARMFKLSV